MKTKNLNLLKVLFSIIFIGASVYYVIMNWAIFSAIGNISIVILFCLIGYAFVSLIFVALTFKYQMKLFNINLKFKEWFGLTITNTMYNYILPARSGFVARAIYMKNKYSFDYSKYISFVSGAFIISFLTAAFLAFVIQIIKYAIYRTLDNELFFISLTLLVVTFACFIVLWKTKQVTIETKWVRLNKILNNIIAGFLQFKSSPILLLKVVIINFITIIALALRLYFSFIVINIDVHFGDVVLIQAILTFSIIISFTPGNLGVKEGVITIMGMIIGIPPQDAILAAAIDRTISMINIFLFGLIYHFVLLQEMNAYKKK